MSDFQEEGTGGLTLEGSSLVWIDIPASGGIVTGPPDSLAELVASSETFQDWVGASDAPEAKRRVYVYAASAIGPLPFVRPFAAVVIPDGSYLETRKETGAYTRGGLGLWFEEDVPSFLKDCPNAVFNRFGNIVEAILQEMITNEGSGTLFVRGIRPAKAPERSNLDREDFMCMMLTVQFGVD